MSTKPIQLQARPSIPEFFQQFGTEALLGKPTISLGRAYQAFGLNKYASPCLAPFLNWFRRCFNDKALSEHILVEEAITTSLRTAAWLGSAEVAC